MASSKRTAPAASRSTGIASTFSLTAHIGEME
jgi:hypothetical protein